MRAFSLEQNVQIWTQSGRQKRTLNSFTGPNCLSYRFPREVATSQIHSGFLEVSFQEYQARLSAILAEMLRKSLVSHQADGNPL